MNLLKSGKIFSLWLQVKIFCDKGAERKLRDEERRAAKRRMTPSGKRRLDEMYHETYERSAFARYLSTLCFRRLPA